MDEVLERAIACDYFGDVPSGSNFPRDDPRRVQGCVEECSAAKSCRRLWGCVLLMATDRKVVC